MATINKDRAGYTEEPNRFHCRDCEMFERGKFEFVNHCSLVEGLILSLATCKFWEHKK